MWVVPMNKISHNTRQTTGMNVTVDPHTDLSLLKPLPHVLDLKQKKKTKRISKRYKTATKSSNCIHLYIRSISLRLFEQKTGFLLKEPEIKLDP